MLKLVLLFILVPIIELGLLIELGRFWGTVPTLSLIVVTGFLGGVLVRHQGLGVLREMRVDVADGRVPARAMVDGAIILVAGAMLLTPGVLTDAFGFLCLLPVSRKVIRSLLWRWIQRAVRDGRLQAEESKGIGSRQLVSSFLILPSRTCSPIYVWILRTSAGTKSSRVPPRPPIRNLVVQNRHDERRIDYRADR